MKYSLINKKNELLFGPSIWDVSKLSSVLFDLGLSVSLPFIAPNDRLFLLNDLSIIPTVVSEVVLKFDEEVTGYEFIVENTIAYYTEIINKIDEEKLLKKTLEKKAALIREVAIKKRKVEEGGVTVIIEGTPCVLDSDRDSQGMIHRTFSFMKDPVKWKLKDNVSWVIINKAHMGLVIQTLLQHIQMVFNKEEILQEKINASSFEELLIFDVDKEWDKLNVV